MAFLLWPLGLTLDLSSPFLAPAYLPAAAWLGWRYGAVAFSPLALGAAPLLISLGLGSVETVGNTGLYVATLIVFRLFADPDYRARCLAANMLTTRQLVFLALVGGTVIGWHLAGGPIGLGVGWSPGYWLSLTVFLAGLSRIPARPLLTTLAAVVLLGLACRFINVFTPVYGFSVAPALDSPADLVRFATLFACGRWTASALQARTFGPRPLYLIIGLAAAGAAASVSVSVPKLYPAGIAFVQFADATVLAPLLLVLGLTAGRSAALVGLAAAALAGFAAPVAYNGAPIHTALGPALSYLPYLAFAVLGWRVREALRPTARAGAERAAVKYAA